MSEPDPAKSPLELNAESELRGAEIADLADLAARKAGRVLVLTIAGVVILGWALLEAAPPVAMALTLVAILPLKAAIRRVLDLNSKKKELQQILKTGADLDSGN